MAHNSWIASCREEPV